MYLQLIAVLDGQKLIFERSFEVPTVKLFCLLYSVWLLWQLREVPCLGLMNNCLHGIWHEIKLEKESVMKHKDMRSRRNLLPRAAHPQAAPLCPLHCHDTKFIEDSHAMGSIVKYWISSLVAAHFLLAIREASCSRLSVNVVHFKSALMKWKWSSGWRAADPVLDF